MSFKHPAHRTKVLTAAFTAAAVLISGCSGGGGGSDSTPDVDNGGGTGGGTTARSVIDAFTNDYLIPDYSQLDQAAANMQATVRALRESPSETTLSAAKSSWVATREPWEKSETALFGPVDFFGFDPSMDTWPVNQTDLQGVLQSGQPLTTSSVANLDPSLKGFHTIEFLLFGSSRDKTAADFTAREFDYLVATVDELRSITSALLASWTTGINGQPPYAAEFQNAGQGSTAFPTEQSAVEQIVRAMMGICDEVANGKIADPFDQRNPNIVESQFSFNSTADFANNIRGVKLVLDTSLTTFIASRNPGLATKINDAVDNAIAAILRIPEPFRDAIQDPANDSTTIAAQEATRNVLTILQNEVLPVVIS